MGQALTICKGCETPWDCYRCVYLHDWIMEAIEIMGKYEEMQATANKRQVSNPLRPNGFRDLESLEKEIKQVKAERDAAIADLRHGDNCYICKYFKSNVDCACDCTECSDSSCMCRNCTNESNWAWRGPTVGGEAYEE